MIQFRITHLSMLSLGISLLIAFSTLIPSLATTYNTNATRVNQEVHVHTGSYGGFGGYGGFGYGNFAGHQHPPLLLQPGVVQLGPNTFYDNRFVPYQRHPADFFSTM